MPCSWIWLGYYRDFSWRYLTNTTGTQCPFLNTGASPLLSHHWWAKDGPYFVVETMVPRENQKIDDTPKSQLSFHCPKKNRHLFQPKKKHILYILNEISGAKVFTQFFRGGNRRKTTRMNVCWPLNSWSCPPKKTDCQWIIYKQVTWYSRAATGLQPYLLWGFP